MKTICERIFESECAALHASGASLSTDKFSPRVQHFFSVDELDQMILDWRQRYGDLHAEQLRQAGFSPHLVKVFAS